MNNDLHYYRAMTSDTGEYDLTEEQEDNIDKEELEADILIKENKIEKAVYSPTLELARLMKEHWERKGRARD